MSTAAYLAGARRDAEGRMTSRATVWREDPDDPVVVDGLASPRWVREQTDLPGRLAASSGAGQSRTATVGQTDVQLAVRAWHSPATTTGIRDGDVLEITAGENVGLFLRVVESTAADQATALRLPVVEVQKPEGIL